jgi:hypothetical protein
MTKNREHSSSTFSSGAFSLALAFWPQRPQPFRKATLKSGPLLSFFIPEKG